ncbi:hypothetical protein [Nocardia jiangsuensis]|uniref:Uncharacterized protein n=1 Tax=Nocardia jiangsuensis TaxID=1691563 RepID=A0ABV8DT11_9NOCA
MNFSIDVPYDEQLLRRTPRHLLGRSVLSYRSGGRPTAPFRPN